MSSTNDSDNDLLVGSVFDDALKCWISLKSLRILRLCPVDEFFSAHTTGLHGSTLAALANKGYLNRETTKDGLELEYYLNNHGHRVRRMKVQDFPKRTFDNQAPDRHRK